MSLFVFFVMLLCFCLFFVLFVCLGAVAVAEFIAESPRLLRLDLRENEIDPEWLQKELHPG